MDNLNSLLEHCDVLNNIQNITTAFTVVQNSTGAQPQHVAQIMVKECPDVCFAIYGDGNPDISGIGIYISFVTQAVYWSLFRPILASLFLLLPPAKEIKSGSVMSFLKRLRSLSDAVHGTSIFLNFTTVVAGLVRIRQSPPEYEALYLQLLSAYINTLSSSSVLTAWAFSESPIPSSGPIFYECLEIINGVLSSYLKLNASTYREDLTAVQLVRTECAQERLYPSRSDHKDLFPWLQELALLTAIQFTFFTLGAILTNMESKLPASKVVLFWKRLKNSRKALVIWLISYNILAIISVVLKMIILYMTRRKMQAANRSAYSDNEWGFGQVSAIMIWVPTTLWLIRSLISKMPWLKIIAYVMRPLFKSRLGIFVYLILCLSSASLTRSLDELDPGSEKEVKHDKKPEGKKVDSTKQSSTTRAIPLPPQPPQQQLQPPSPLLIAPVRPSQRFDHSRAK